MLQESSRRQNMKNNHIVIMAGGVGSRFWPLSTLTPNSSLTFWDAERQQWCSRQCEAI